MEKSPGKWDVLFLAGLLAGTQLLWAWERTSSLPRQLFSFFVGGEDATVENDIILAMDTVEFSVSSVL